MKPIISAVANIDGPIDGPVNHPPSAVAICDPQDNASFCMCNSDQPMTFVWNSSKDPDQDTVRYAWFLIDRGERRVLLSEETGQDTSLDLETAQVSSVFPAGCLIHRASWKVGATDGRSAVFSPEFELTVLNQNETNSDLPSSFPQGFSAPHDQLTGKVLGGWGGCSGCVMHTPIVFLHGNDPARADTWRSVAQRFLDNGYVPRELWAISYIDFSGGDSATSSMGNTAEIDQFVSRVLDYTGAEKVDLIAHSLGVTVARAWMKETNGYDKINHFIAIAGPNHGVNFCSFQPGSAMCQEIGHPDSPFLTCLNNQDETPQDDMVAYLTIYDGTNADVFYLSYSVLNDGSIADLRLSPCLEGATNAQLAGKDHMQLKDSQESFDLMYSFLTGNRMYAQH